MLLSVGRNRKLLGKQGAGKMSKLIHVDGDEIDLTYRLELSDEDLNKIKDGEFNRGKYFVHKAYLAKLFIEIELVNADFNFKGLIKFEYGKFEYGLHLTPEDKNFKFFMVSYFTDKLIKSNKIATKMYRYNDNFYIDALIIGSI